MGTAFSHGQRRIVLVNVSWTLLSTCRTIHAAYKNYGHCCVCRWLVHAQRLHPAMGRHEIELMLVSWTLPSTWRMICGTINAAYINYGQYCVCRWLVHAQRLHPAMGRHEIELMLVSWTLPSTWRMICGTINAAYINYGQYCVCRWLVHAQRLHPAMGRHSIVLALVSRASLSTWCMIGGIIHAAYLEWVNTVPADV